MKIVHTEILINSGSFGETSECTQILQEIFDAIAKVVWPITSDKFIINPTPKGNGVKPIKTAFQNHLVLHNWELEARLNVGITEQNPGPIDAVKLTDHNKFFAVEWETGNISSSHRALNKIVGGILSNVLVGGALILPSRKLYTFLTDRIGNFEELRPYFPVWRSSKCDPGFLIVIAVEHDEIGTTVPFIPKGTDGRAKI